MGGWTGLVDVEAPERTNGKGLVVGPKDFDGTTFAAAGSTCVEIIKYLFMIGFHRLTTVIAWPGCRLLPYVCATIRKGLIGVRMECMGTALNTIDTTFYKVILMPVYGRNS